MPADSRTPPSMKSLLPLLLLLAAPLAAQSPDTVKVTLPHGAPITLSPGQKLVVEARGNLTTGHTWLARELPACLVQIGEPAYVADPSDGRVGSGGRFLLTFQALKVGEGRLELAYVRPWEKDTPPAETASLRVTVK
jgi:inhibitor of cysteine peptidase